MRVRIGIMLVILLLFVMPTSGLSSSDFSESHVITPYKSQYTEGDTVQVKVTIYPDPPSVLAYRKTPITFITDLENAQWTGSINFASDGSRAIWGSGSYLSDEIGYTSGGISSIEITLTGKIPAVGSAKSVNLVKFVIDGQEGLIPSITAEVSPNIVEPTPTPDNELNSGDFTVTYSLIPSKDYYEAGDTIQVDVAIYPDPPSVLAKRKTPFTFSTDLELAFWTGSINLASGGSRPIESSNSFLSDEIGYTNEGISSIEFTLTGKVPMVGFLSKNITLVKFVIDGQEDIIDPIEVKVTSKLAQPTPTPISELKPDDFKRTYTLIPSKGYYKAGDTIQIKTIIYPDPPSVLAKRKMPITFITDLENAQWAGSINFASGGSRPIESSWSYLSDEIGYTNEGIYSIELTLTGQVPYDYSKDTISLIEFVIDDREDLLAPITAKISPTVMQPTPTPTSVPQTPKYSTEVRVERTIGPYYLQEGETVSITLGYNMGDATGAIIYEYMTGMSLLSSNPSPSVVGGSEAPDFLKKEVMEYPDGTLVKWVLYDKEGLGNGRIEYQGVVEDPSGVHFAGMGLAIMSDGSMKWAPITGVSDLVKHDLPGYWDDDGIVTDEELLSVIQAWANPDHPLHDKITDEVLLQYIAIWAG